MPTIFNKPEETERGALYRHITSLYDLALAPIPDDPMLEGWKREQAIMRALVGGEVLPTTKHNLFCRSESLPLNFDERQRIKDAQNVLEELCPKYTDAFSEYDRNDLSRWIEDIKARRKKQRQERFDLFRVAHVTEVQDHLFFALELAHKFSTDPDVKKRIEDGTRTIREQWEKETNAAERVQGYAEIAERSGRVCNAYVKLLNDLYAMPDAPAKTTEDMPSGATPDTSPAASIEQNRIPNRLVEIIVKAIKTTPVTVSGFTGKAQTELGALTTITTASKENTEEILKNQPQTMKAAKEWGAAQSQQTRAKAANKAANKAQQA